MSELPPEIAAEMLANKQKNQAAQDTADKLRPEPSPSAWRPTEKNTPRFVGWIAWFRFGIGTCPKCSLAYAIAATEKEDGRDWRPEGWECSAVNERGETCKQAKDRMWPSRPRNILEYSPWPTTP